MAFNVLEGMRHLKGRDVTLGSEDIRRCKARPYHWMGVERLRRVVEEGCCRGMPDLPPLSYLVPNGPWPGITVAGV